MKRAVRLSVLIVAVVALKADAGAAPSRAARRQDDCSTERASARALPLNFTDRKAAVISLEPDAGLAEALDAEDEGARPVRLTVCVVQPVGGSWLGFRVYLNLSDGEGVASVKSPLYVGGAAFYGGREGEEKEFAFDLSRAVRRARRASLLPPGAPLKITLLALPRPKAAQTPTTGLLVTKVRAAVAP